MGTTSIRALLEERPVRLAPMASFTNAPYRNVAVACGSGLPTNEEIDAEALTYRNPIAHAMARIQPGDGPVAMQLLGCKPDALAQAARILADGGAAAIDLNMGCPTPKIVRRGKGAALMRDVSATAAILRAMRAAVPDVPLTIKIRGGWDEAEPNAVEVARMAETEGVDAITVHPRTRAQRFGGHAPWQVIADVVQAVSIPVTGNGDVTSLVEARRMMAETGCVSVMVGRAALGHPWLFDPDYEALDAAGRVVYQARVVAAHLDRIEATMSPREALMQAKKHLSLYLAGRRSMRTWRGELFSRPTLVEVRAVYEAVLATSGDGEVERGEDDGAGVPVEVAAGAPAS